MQQLKEVGRKLLLGLLLTGLCGASFVLGSLYGRNQATQEITKLQPQNDLLNKSSPPSTVAESPTPNPADETAQVAFDDIKGVFGEKEITQLAQLGVFDTTTGKFNPSQPITRTEFLRWLVRANNAIWFDQPNRMIREAEGGQATFADLPSTHPDFRYTQGIANAGIAVGYDQTTFKPDQPLTREQMISIKIGLDKGGIEDHILSNKREGNEEITADRLASGVPNWSDRTQISKRFIPAFNSEYYIFPADWPLPRSEDRFKNVDRTFGAIKSLKPQAPVTRAEAALCISLIGNHASNTDELDFRTAEQALQARTTKGTPSPAP